MRFFFSFFFLFSLLDLGIDVSLFEVDHGLSIPTYVMVPNFWLRGRWGSKSLGIFYQSLERLACLLAHAPNDCEALRSDSVFLLTTCLM